MKQFRLFKNGFPGACTVGLVLVMVVALGFAPRAEALPGPPSAIISNPDWEIGLWDSGYSDLLLDKRPGFEGREYLSGEWAGAVGYKKGATTVTPDWLEPCFIFPDWATGSAYSVVSGLSGTAVINASGFEIFSSTISNGDLEIKQSYEMVDTTIDGGSGPTGPGIEQGEDPAVTGGSGFSTTSNRYILKQGYGIKNVSGEGITDLQLFQFLHSLNAEKAVYDDRSYGPSPWGDYKYDITQRGKDFTPGGFLHDDVVSFHSKAAPSAWEVGYYGDEDIDSHEVGKPSIGVHLEVEGNSLDTTTDFFEPGEFWVSGAQRFDLIDLADGESASFDVLLSIQTSTTEVPEPGTWMLLGTGLVGLIGWRRKRNG